MAQFKTEQYVSHISPSQGEFTNDDKELVSFDSTKVDIQTDLSVDKEGLGSRFIEYKWGLSDNYHEFKKAYPNFLSNAAAELCTITWNIETTGKKSSLMVMDIKPKQILK